MSNLMLEITRKTDLKTKPEINNLGFGKHFSDHMLMMDFSEGEGWKNPRIVPYAPITLDPAAMVFHYGQSVFEGLKAFRTEDDRILLFRPDKNIQRLNHSSERLSIPQLDEKRLLTYLTELIKLEKDWVPAAEGTSLYIRPFIIATEPNLSLAPSKTYTLIVILSPVGSYYKEGIDPVSIYVEDEYSRAVRGGTGTAKTAGNYSAAYIAQERAEKQGMSQVLWLDALEKKYIEEVGSMNVFFKINGEVITPVLNGSILKGITRMSIIELLNEWGIQVSERKVSLEELFHAYKNGELEEAFGTGTAAVVSPIGEMLSGDQKIIVNNGETGELTKRIYHTLTSIQRGVVPDSFNWNVEVK